MAAEMTSLEQSESELLMILTQLYGLADAQMLIESMKMSAGQREAMEELMRSQYHFEAAQLDTLIDS